MTSTRFLLSISRSNFFAWMGFVFLVICLLVHFFLFQFEVFKITHFPSPCLRYHLRIRIQQQLQSLEFCHYDAFFLFSESHPVYFHLVCLYFVQPLILLPIFPYLCCRICFVLMICWHTFATQTRVGLLLLFIYDSWKGRSSQAYPIRQVLFFQIFKTLFTKITYYFTIFQLMA